MDYETLKIIWWLLIGIILIAFALTDGYTMGSLILMPLIGKTDTERSVVIEAVAPHWEGNQVWFIIAGAGMFAAWPMVYATAFSGFYWAMYIILFALFFRPAGFDYRSKSKDPRWRRSCEWGLFIGGLVPALIFGVALGNIMQGLPFHLDDTLRSFYHGNLFGLLNPFALLAGVVSVAMLVTHGAAWLVLRTGGVIMRRAQETLRIAGLLYLLAFIGVGIWLVLGIQGYTLTSMPDPDTALNPLRKVVSQDNPGWLNNYRTYPITLIAPIAAFAGGLIAIFTARISRGGWSILGSSLVIVGTIATFGFALFPFIFPSSEHAISSLTMWDAVSSYKTLGIMFAIVCIFLPINLAYTAWCFIKMWHRVDTASVNAD